MRSTRPIQQLVAIIAVAVLLGSLGGYAAAGNNADDARIIRAQGLVIEDKDGNPRIGLSVVDGTAAIVL